MDILEVIGRRVELRRAGKEHLGLCPFHAEKTPSFTVSVKKQVFYCHGCHIGGDAIRFVELIEQTDFKGALKLLGISGGRYIPKARDILKQRAAATVATWMNDQHLKAGAMLRELTRNIVVAEEAGVMTLIERWQHEFSILEILFDDLARPECAAELWAMRGAIEGITERAPVEPLPEFPPWTPEYAAYLAAHLPALEVAA
jgi:CHC2 zinc finger